MRKYVCVSTSLPNPKPRHTGTFEECQTFLTMNQSKFRDLQIYTEAAFQEMTRPRPTRKRKINNT